MTLTPKISLNPILDIISKVNCFFLSAVKLIEIA